MSTFKLEDQRTRKWDLSEGMRRKSGGTVFILGVKNQTSCKASPLNRVRVEKPHFYLLDKWLLEQKAKLAPFLTSNWTLLCQDTGAATTQPIKDGEILGKQTRTGHVEKGFTQEHGMNDPSRTLSRRTCDVLRLPGLQKAAALAGKRPPSFPGFL